MVKIGDAMYTAADINAMIKSWTESPAGKARLRQEGVGIYTESEMQLIATKLRNDIVNAFFALQSTPLTSANAGVFDMRRVAVTNTGKNSLQISFNPASLKRNSLMRYPGPGYTGSGIKDIFALFTQGWHARAYVYGNWYAADQSGWRGDHNRRDDRTIRSRRYYPGNPFITHVVNAYIAEYPGLKITYPAEWGG